MPLIGGALKELTVLVHSICVRCISAAICTSIQLLVSSGAARSLTICMAARRESVSRVGVFGARALIDRPVARCQYVTVTKPGIDARERGATARRATSKRYAASRVGIPLREKWPGLDGDPPGCLQKAASVSLCGVMATSMRAKTSASELPPGISTLVVLN